MRLGSQRLQFLAGLILLLAGLDIAVTLTYLARWVGLILMILGLGILVLTARREPQKEEGEEDKEGEIDEGEEDKEVEGSKIKEKRTLAEILISALTLNGKIKMTLPIIGVFLIIFVYAFNLFISKRTELGVNDTITLLFGVTLIVYNYIPQNYNRERDFVLLFFTFLFMILVLPLQLYSLMAGPIQENTNSPFVFHLLAKPTSDMLNFFGISATTHSVPPQQLINGVNLTKGGVWIVYENLGDSAQQPYSSVGIGFSCTGLYSVSIFISGFIAFILIEYRKFDIRVASLLTLGVFTSWFANILRMTIIVAVGSHYGAEALSWTHANMGIFIFMLWVGLFWGVMFKLLVPKDQGKVERDEREEETKEELQGVDEVPKESLDECGMTTEKEPVEGAKDVEET
jgi:exosortase/archaeosortase family protein